MKNIILGAIIASLFSIMYISWLENETEISISISWKVLLVAVCAIGGALIGLIRYFDKKKTSRTS